MSKYLLHEKVLEGDIDEIARIIPHCENIDELDDFGYAPLHWAVINMQEDVVRLLVQARANINVTSTQGLTPQLYAMEFGYQDIVQLLAAC